VLYNGALGTGRAAGPSSLEGIPAVSYSGALDTDEGGIFALDITSPDRGRATPAAPCAARLITDPGDT
jgi:hypothetical protein